MLEIYIISLIPARLSLALKQILGRLLVGAGGGGGRFGKWLQKWRYKMLTKASTIYE